MCLESGCDNGLLGKLLNTVDKYKEQIIENCKTPFPTEWIIRVSTNSLDQLQFEEMAVPVRFDIGKMCIFNDLYFPFYEEGKIQHGSKKLYNILIDENKQFYIAYLIVTSTNANAVWELATRDQIIENMQLKINPISLSQLQRLLYLSDITGDDELWLSQDRIQQIEKHFEIKRFYRTRY